MAGIKPKKCVRSYTLNWRYPESGMHLAVEVRIFPAREWYDSAESRDSTWQIVPGDVPGSVVALRPMLT